MNEATKHVCHLTTQLDLRFRRWDLYRAELGHWIVKIGTDTVSDETLVGAMEKAVIFRPLPVIPRAPDRLSRSLFVARKQSASKWALMYDGSDCGVYNIKSKRLAEQAADKLTEQSHNRRDDWDAQYGAMVANGTEGTDYRYAI